jgi:hypothetical protein
MGERWNRTHTRGAMSTVTCTKWPCRRCTPAARRYPTKCARKIAHICEVPHKHIACPPSPPPIAPAPPPVIYCKPCCPALNWSRHTTYSMATCTAYSCALSSGLPSRSPVHGELLTVIVLLKAIPKAAVNETNYHQPVSQVLACCLDCRPPRGVEHSGLSHHTWLQQLLHVD